MNIPFFPGTSDDWTPPDYNQCVQAFEVTPSNFREQENVKKLLSLNTFGAFTPKIAPRAGDWLADGGIGMIERPGQNFNDFVQLWSGFFSNK